MLANLDGWPFSVVQLLRSGLTAAGTDCEELAQQQAADALGRLPSAPSSAVAQFAAAALRLNDQGLVVPVRSGDLLEQLSARSTLSRQPSAAVSAAADGSSANVVDDLGEAVARSLAATLGATAGASPAAWKMIERALGAVVALGGNAKPSLRLRCATFENASPSC